VESKDFIPAEVGEVAVGDSFTLEVKGIGPCSGEVIAVYDALRVAVALAISDDLQERRFVEIDLSTLRRPPTLH